MGQRDDHDLILRNFETRKEQKVRPLASKYYFTIFYITFIIILKGEIKIELVEIYTETIKIFFIIFIASFLVIKHFRDGKSHAEVMGKLDAILKELQKNSREDDSN